MKRIVCAWVPLAALWLAASARVGAQGSDETRYYKVYGRSARDLRESMNAARPTASDGQPHDARTAWSVHWKYRTVADRNHCDVTSFDVTLDIVMTLPQWVNEAGAPAPLVAQWHKFNAALLTHEAGHKSIATQAADAIRTAGRRLASQPNCADVARTVASTGNGILAQYQQKDRQYDADTNHGQTQGARFP